MQAKHKKFLALSQSDTLERRSHENVAKWMNYIDNGDSVDANDDDDDGLPPRIGRSVSPNSPPDARAPSAGKPQNPDNGAQPTPIPNPFLLLQRKIKQKNQSLSHIRKSHSYVCNHCSRTTFSEHGAYRGRLLCSKVLAMAKARASSSFSRHRSVRWCVRN